MLHPDQNNASVQEQKIFLIGNSIWEGRISRRAQFLMLVLKGYVKHLENRSRKEELIWSNLFKDSSRVNGGCPVIVKRLSSSLHHLDQEMKLRLVIKGTLGNEWKIKYGHHSW